MYISMFSARFPSKYKIRLENFPEFDHKKNFLHWISLYIIWYCDGYTMIQYYFESDILPNSEMDTTTTVVCINDFSVLAYSPCLSNLFQMKYYA